jgi:hypothetical protein
MKRIVCSLVVCAAIGAAGAAHAQGYYRPRPQYSYNLNPMNGIRGYIGFAGLGTGVLAQSGGAELLDNGGGVSIYGGLRFGPIFALELNWTGSFHNPALGCVGDVNVAYCTSNYLVLDLLSVDAKIHLPTGTNFDPYFQGGLAAAWIGREGFAADAKGGGIDLGGGFDLWLNPWWTFGVRGLYRGVSMDDFATVTDQGRTFLSLFTLELNLAAHF